jgi:uncharacterized protein YbjT (DUF2867 family)
MKILVTGISGYVGGALAPRLRELGHEVVGLSRDPARNRIDFPVYRGDVNTGEGLAEALERAEIAYYLAHSLESENPEGYAIRDRRMALNFVEAARAAGVRRVIHLGVFDVDPPAKRSSHQKSRLEVDEIVRSTTPESLTLRASAVIGPSNWYFQALVNMVARLPLLALPKRGRLRLQPIDERDAIECLARAATSDDIAGRAVDIGGDIVTQEEFVLMIARAMGRERRVLRLPFSAPAFLSRVFALVGGGDPAILRPLFYTGLTDNLAHEDGAGMLGVHTRALEDSLRHTLARMGRLHASGEAAPQPVGAG